MPPLAIFLLGMTVSSAASVSADLVAEGRERLRTRRALERYVSPGLTREILDHRAEFLQSLGGARREVTILFSDVRGFTARTEAGDPTEVFEELNEYFGHMVEEILKAEGAIDKFLGDGILATWGTLGRLSPKEAATAGIQCALAMRQALKTLNASRAARGLEVWEVGIGLHSGSVLFGNVGSQTRMEPTVIGDTVNLASRIEGLTKALGCDTLISESCRELAGGITAYRSADLVQVIGRRAPVHVFALPPESFSPEDLSMHEDAIRLFRSAKFEESLSLFERLSVLHPEDALSAIYQKRCRAFMETPPPPDWTGVFVAEKK
jgi:adenylate cyclase